MTLTPRHRTGLHLALAASVLVVACATPSPEDDVVSPADELAVSRRAATIPVWIDVDPAVLRGGSEPDDGLALVQAFHSPELDVVGVSVVFGNAPLDVAFPNGQEIVARYAPRLPIYKGASGSDERGETTEASEALAEALGKERLTILALGPVTNVATVLALHPELADRVDAVIAVAGRRAGQRFVLGDESGTPLMDMNFEFDAEGFQTILDADVPLVLAPFEISAKTPLAESDIESLKNTEFGEFFYWPLKDYVDWYDDRFSIRAIYPFDTLAVAYLTSPEMLQCDDLPIEIQSLPDDIETDQDKPYLIVDAELQTEQRARYCHTASDEFIPDLVARLRGAQAP